MKTSASSVESASSINHVLPLRNCYQTIASETSNKTSSHSWLDVQVVACDGMFSFCEALTDAPARVIFSERNRASVKIINQNEDINSII